MAGTRLLVHAAFVVELAALVASALLYASTRSDESPNAEPFFVDKSGWNLLEEDLWPIDEYDAAGPYRRAAKTAAELFDGVVSLLGLEQEAQYHERPVRTSIFIHEMRQAASTLLSPAGLPSMHVELQLPQKEMRAHVGAVEKIFAKVANTKHGHYDERQVSCDEFQLSSLSSREEGESLESRRPRVVILAGCEESEILQSSDTFLVKTDLDSQGEQILQFLSDEIVPVLAEILSLTASSSYRLGSVEILLIDEEPLSHVNGRDGARTRVETLGKLLSSTSERMLGRTLDDLSFLYSGGVHIDENDANSISTDPSGPAVGLVNLATAYLPLPKEMISTLNEDENLNYISGKNMARFIHDHSSRRVFDKHDAETIEWVLFIPSVIHSPLRIGTGKDGELGTSIVLSHSTTNGVQSDINPGVSLLNIDAEIMSNQAESNSLYKDEMSRIGSFIRRKHGLPDRSDSRTLNSSVPIRNESDDAISYWELEAIARAQYQTTLEHTLVEVDALASLLYRHSRTLSVPKAVAQNLNKATSLLRKSISFANDGYIIHATSALHGSRRFIEKASTNSRLMEPPYFAPDHYLAVFSPLVLPLAIPMLAGLIREVKRYRELTMKVH
mmetsp:Transcript_16116/g.35576  ORF Transcript_16116/g.35576 Transcript_16116/m.35576 type:complete len:615 (-) Transcript_16116:21-1865(-)